MSTADTPAQTIQLGPDQLDQIRPADRITAINGTPLPGGPVTVTRALSALSGTAALSIGIRAAHGTPANLYPDSTIDRSVTVERDVVAPAPATPAAPAAAQPRTVSRTVNGIKLHSDGKGGWWTSDRRYEIRKGFGGMTECEASHPVRLTPELVQHARDNNAAAWAQPILWAAHNGKRGFICQGGSEHSYEEWACWDYRADDYALGGQLNHGESWAALADGLTRAIAAGQA